MNSRWSCRFSPTPARSATTSIPNAAELGRRPDAGELQQLGRIDRPAAQDHLAPRARLVVASAAPVVRTPTARRPSKAMRVASACVTTLRLRAFHRRPQIGVGGRRAHAVPHRHVEGAKPLLPLAVEVGAHRIAGLAARLDEGLVERVALGALRGRERPAVAAPGVGAAAQSFRRGGSRAARSDIPSPWRLPLPSARNRADGRAHRRGH